MGYINLPPVGWGSWQAPVANLASLPGSGNVNGDARVVLGDGGNHIYVWDDAYTQWVPGNPVYWSLDPINSIIYPESNRNVSIGTTSNLGGQLNVNYQVFVSNENGDYISLMSDGNNSSEISLYNEYSTKINFVTSNTPLILDSTGSTLFFRDSTGNVGMVFDTAGNFYASRPTSQGTTYTLNVTGARLGINNPAPSCAIDAIQTGSTANAVVDMLKLNYQCSVTPAVGIGAGIQFATETANTITKTGARIAALTTNVTAGSESFDLVAYTMLNNAVPAERLRITSAGDVKAATGSISTETAGKGYRVKEGTNAKMGLTGAFPGTNPNRVTVTTTAVASNSRIFLQVQAYTGNHNPAVKVYSVTAGTSFIIEAYDINFVGTVAWLIFDPA